MLNVYSALNNSSSVGLLEAQQQQLLSAQQTAVQPNSKTAASVETIQQQAIRQTQLQTEQQVNNQVTAIGSINEYGQVTGAFINESV
jgi:hypothetical protein